ncbi:YciI family protein [Phytohabitans suffuscus]|uniref:YCII-related domain-containing protein n=1 Tax=Phytohabitans suffuscus TaxID=624315 RepID=A0A6F8YPB9_9ACTN|nr:YciI family protein [Phytohabitans suffuscus]BCB87879.1 hypothetical protein Psuf_051920 [Phytohabitans suffuscus]
MKYVILIRHNLKALELWASMPAEERAEGLAAYAALTEDLAASGELVVSEALAHPSTAKLVDVRDGKVIASDGPYAEVKEHLAGFYLIECDSIDRAIQVAARIPEAAFAQIEVRPVLDDISVDV